MRSPPVDTEDKDLPLRDDIRLLGRILGDTVREQTGEAVFDIVERIRQSSVRFRRDEDIAARRELAETLNSTPSDEALQIIRAFTFSRISPTSPKISTTFAAPVPTL
jgi:phosphoenolpyruvate carboxylase